MIKVVTVLKSGPVWKPDYVYKLQRAVAKTLTIPYEFVCLSDLELDVPTLPLIDLGYDHTIIPKFWYKLQLFRPELSLNGPCLFIDLDTLIKNNINHWIEKFEPHKFLMSYSPFRGKISCSYLMWWQGDHSHLWHDFIKRPLTHWDQTYHKGRPDKYGDQGFLAEHAEHNIVQEVLGPDHGIVRITKNESRDASDVLIFGGKRKPWDMDWHPDVQKYWI